MEPAAQPVEIELKYRLLAPLGLDTVLAYASAAGFSPESEAAEVIVRDRYLDTASGSLARAGIAARIRLRADGVRVTVKTPAQHRGAVVRRTELESIAVDSLDPADWPSSPAREAVAEHAGGEPLVETVTLEQVRRVAIVTDGLSHVELSVDDVSVVAGGRLIDRFEELEAELRSGEEEALRRLAAAFERDPTVAIGAGSKLERAMAAVAAAGLPVPGPFAEAPDTAGDAAEDADAALQRNAERVVAAVVGAGLDDVVAPTGRAAEALTLDTTALAPAVTSIVVRPPGRTPGVTRDDAFAEAGRKVLRFHFARMLAREEGTRSGDVLEDLHGMRVATRRMRAAWRVFGEAFRPGRTRRLRTHLREVATRLGAVRDLDVLIEALQAYGSAVGQADRDNLRPLVDAWTAERDDARVLLVRELDSAAYRSWVAAYSGFVLAEGRDALPPPGPTSPLRVREMAGSRLWLAYEEARAYEQSLRWADLATLHQLRITSKRLRYAIEFFREALGEDAAALIPRVVALQDHLGALHDAEVAGGRARTFLVEQSSRLAEAETAAIGRYLASREKEIARLRRTVGRPWRAVAGPSFRRALGRAIAEL